jgi:hypothetical protein
VRNNLQETLRAHVFQPAGIPERASIQIADGNIIQPEQHGLDLTIPKPKDKKKSG